VLLGSIAEAALLDLMQRRETEARECESATRGKLERWHLHTMIDVAKELKAIKPGTAAISHIMRGYRNLIHPGNSEAQSLEPGMSQAVAASDFILALFRDLVDLH
jgi:hypothetical protein